MNDATQRTSDVLAALNAQLERCMDADPEARVSLAGDDETTRALEARLNRLLEAAHGKAISKHPLLAEHKKLHLLLDSIVDNVPIMLFIKAAADGRLLLWNKAGEQVMGKPREEMIGKTDFDLVPYEDAAFYAAKDREVLEGGKLVAVDEHIFTPGGEERWLYTKKIPLHDERGEPAYLLGISEDITERKRVNDELRRAKEEAEAANRTKGDFLANVSHELRTPLTLILGPLEALVAGEAGPLTPEVLERLHLMRRNTARLHALVNDLLDFSKLEAGKAEVHWSTVSPLEVIGDVVQDASPLAVRRHVALRGPSPEHDPGSFPLDRRMFEKIVLNLVGNALKFTPAGGAVDVLLTGSDAGIELCVQDTGIGIAPDKIPLLFQRFQQVDTSASRRYEGTGIGLALVKELAESMGGTAFVESELGRGSRFYVRIPNGALTAVSPLPPPAPEPAFGAVDGEEDREREREEMDLLYEEPNIPEPPRTFTGKPRLILAEDNHDMRAYVYELLASRYDIVAVDNGRAALEAARKCLPDVIVSDVMMPEMNGFELVAALKSDPALRQVPVLLLTARAGQGAVASGLELGGADDYLTKPFSPAELRARVAAAHRLHQAYQDVALRMDELLVTRDQLVEAEKLSLAGRLSRAVAREIRAPLESLLATVTSVGVLASSPDAARAIARVGELVAGLERLAEPPGSSPRERTNVVKLVRSVVAEVGASLGGAAADSRVAMSIEQEDVITCISPEDLRLALKNVFSFLRRTARRARANEARDPSERRTIAVHLDQEWGRPCITLADPSLELSADETAQLLDPRIMLAVEAGHALELDTGLTIASQVLRRNGAELHVHAPKGGGLAFQFSLQPGDETDANWLCP
ncbi:MAG TPA: ATP-binding protein [Polyangiaceae bacterium]|nr:ATP-binding protein [Polyangiaceae bacterium]